MCGESVDGGACNRLNFEHLAKSTRQKVDVFFMRKVMTEKDQGSLRHTRIPAAHTHTHTHTHLSLIHI